MNRRIFFCVGLFVALSLAAVAQVTVIDSFDAIPGPAGWVTSMGVDTSGQNINVADGGTMVLSTAHVTQGTGCGQINLNWSKPAVNTTSAGEWPGTAPVWGCRWYNLSGASVTLSTLSDTISIDVYNETGDPIQFALVFRDQGNAGDLIRGPYVTLASGANTYSFVPQTDAVVWIVTGNGVVDGTLVINSMLFTSDNEPGSATDVFYVDNLRRQGTQTDTTPPAQPILKAVTPKDGTTDQVTVSWFANTDSDLFGYRLYTADTIDLSNSLTPINWGSTPVQDETTLTAGATETTVNIGAGGPLTLFRLTAVDNATPQKNESPPSIPLAAKLTGTTAPPQILCVMDLKRYPPENILYGGNGYKYDRFIMFLANALDALNEPFFSATGKGVGAGTVSLTPEAYKLVTWSTGVDGATVAPIVPAVEPTAMSSLTSFVVQGGHLYMSGTFAAADLATTPTGQFLLAEFGAGSVGSTGGNQINAPATGSIFEGITAQLLTNDQYDYAAYASTTNNVLSLNGGVTQLTYVTPAAGIAATSRVGPGRTVLGGVAFESLRQDNSAPVSSQTSVDARTQFIQKILAFMGPAPSPVTGVQALWQMYD